MMPCHEMDVKSKDPSRVIEVDAKSSEYNMPRALLFLPGQRVVQAAK